MTSPYAQIGATLVDNGYSAIPVRPGTKLPGAVSFGQWYGLLDWAKYCDRLPTEIEYGLWSDRWADAGVCVACGMNGVIAIDIDTDDETLIDAIQSVLPPSPVMKRGAKGYTAFYRGSREIRAQAFNLSGRRVLDLLAHGKQTVIPPTPHPDGGAYHWTTDDTLETVTPEQLPELPDNIGDRIGDVLSPFGYNPISDRRTAPAEGDTPWRELNDKAMADFTAWVPALGLTKTRRYGNKYKAIPDFRPSSSGRPLKERGQNLSFSPEGIKDFGSETTYTPIDVVMAAFEIDFHAAYEWLSKQVGYTVDLGVQMNIPSIIENGLRKGAIALPAAEMPVAADVPRAPVAAPRGTVDPFDPASAGGLLGTVARLIIDTARRPSQEFATLAAIGLCSGLFGRRYVGPSGFGLNLYMVGLAPPSFGKEHPQDVVKTIACDCGMPWILGPAPTSDAAIEKILRRDPCKLMILDEFGILLQGVNSNRAAAHTETIRKAFLELYTKSRANSIWLGKESADPTKISSPLHAPTLSVLGFSTPTTFYEGISSSNLSDGFMARLLVISAGSRGAKQKTPPVFVTPPSLMEAVKGVAMKFPNKSGSLVPASWRDPNQRPSIYAVPWATPDAERRFDDVEEWQVATTDGDPGAHGLVGRAAEQTQKLATLRAISRCSEDPSVTEDDIEWGYAIVQRSIDSIEIGIKRHMAGSPFEALWKAILAAVTEAGADGLAKSQIGRRKGISQARPQDFDAALKWLQETKMVEMRVNPGPGRKGGRYVVSSEPDADAA